jgi:Zn-dependent M28 family amino/carboxypeptidase
LELIPPCTQDSVENSPGINAGSGAATSLAIALTLAKLSYQPTNKLVFAWWSGKEVGDAGISRYLNSMTEEQIIDTAAYINLNIVGSQNYIPYVSLPFEMAH